MKPLRVSIDRALPEPSWFRAVGPSLLAWTLLVGAMVAAGYFYSRQEARSIALFRARDSLQKDLVYRRWATQRGGVYVPLDAKTPANPYLKGIPNREVTTTSGQVLTLVNPAYMTRMVHELGASDYGLKGHITSLDPIRPENAPDAWERATLQTFEAGAREHWEELSLEGRPFLRYMSAFLVEEGCLRCHGAQGYRLGQVRGGISVSVPVEHSGANFLISRNFRVYALGLLALWAVGGVVLGLLAREKLLHARDQNQSFRDLQGLASQQVAILDTTRDGFISLDREGRLLDVNERYLELSGHSREEVLGRRLSDLALEAPIVEERLARIADTGWDRFEFTHRSRSVALISVEASATFNHSDGHIVVFLRDVTSRNKAELALRNSESLLRTYFDAAPDGIFVTDGSGRYLQVNRAAEVMTGYTTQELLGMTVKDLGTPGRKDNQPTLFESLATKSEFLEEIQLHRKDGTTVPVMLRAAKIHEDLVIGLCRDITEQKRQETERRRLELEVQHAQQMESLGSLAGGIAHDMNNVLTAILGLGSVLQLKLTGDPALKKSVETILHAAGRGRDLVKGLTDFARKGLQESRPMDLNELVQREADLLHRTTLQKVEVVVDLEPDLPKVMGESSALGSAIMNLCVNALDAMPRGGRLRLATRDVDGRVELAVEDTGEGMPPEVQLRALEPFFTTKPAGKGTGLGLSMVYGTVKAHGGTLEIESEPGRGTLIRIGLPVAEEPAVLAEPETRQAGSAERSIRVLLVDDDPLIRDTMPCLLETLGHQVVTASGGLEALRQLEAGLEVDLTILDMNMPGMSGIETLSRLRLIRPDLPVVVATGFLDEAAARILDKQTRVTTLMKPYELKVLATKLQQAIR